MKYLNNYLLSPILKGGANKEKLLIKKICQNNIKYNEAIL